MNGRGGKPLDDASPRIEFEHVVLPNGLNLILHVDRKLPVVHVNQWYHVGSKNEEPGRTGFAHLFEHLMFQGSKNVEGEYFQHVEKAGANLREGGVNGTTDFDRTNYFATVPSGNLEFLLWLESDRLATLPEAMTQQKLDGQREVVRNERRQSYENQPYGRSWLLINENIHPKGHPYSWDVIGSHEDLQAATLDDVERFFRRFYTPSNLSLTIAGDFDPAQARMLVERYFGGIAPGPALERPRRWIPSLGGSRILEVAERAPQDRVYVCWPAPGYFHEGEADLDLASRILSEGLSSRLNRSLVYDRHLCTGIHAFNDAREISGIFGVVATLRPGVEARVVEEEISEIIGRLAADGPTEEELSRAKTRWEFDFISGLERIGGFGGKADRLNQYMTIQGEPGLLDQDLLRYRGVSSESLKETLNRWTGNDERLTVRFLRDQVERSSVTLDRSLAPELGEDRPFVAPAVHHETLPNGLEMFVVPRHDLPKIAVTLAIRGGASVEVDGKGGCAQLLISTIDMGTETKGALEIEDDLGNLGTSFSGATMREASGLGFEVLSRNIEPAMELFADVARRPAFPEGEVERERNRHLDGLAQQANHAGSIASKLRSRLLFGADHPYGRPVGGTVESVPLITREDIEAFHRTWWHAANAALVFCGDIDPVRARELSSRYFGDWQSGALEPAPIPPPEPADPGRIYLVDKPDAPQTVVVQMLPGPSRGDEDLGAFRLVDAVWGGGGFGTRLNLNLREDKGYSYGVFSSWSALQVAGGWWASGSVQTDRTRESVEEFLLELRNLAGARPITDEELEAARSTRVRGYAQQFESLSRIAMQIAELWAEELPMSEMQREYEQIVEATMDDVLRVASRWGAPDRSFLLLVGDRSVIEPELRRIEGLELVVLDAEGRALPPVPSPS